MKNLVLFSVYFIIMFLFTYYYEHNLLKSFLGSLVASAIFILLYYFVLNRK